MALRVGQTRSVLLGVFLLLCFILFFRGQEATFDEPGKGKIAIVCMTTDEAPYNYKSLSNKFNYARKHDYHMEFDWFGDGFWHKLKMVQRLIKRKEFDWIWSIDFDTLITNTTIKLEDLINESIATAKNPDDIDLLLTPDCFPLNAGVMLYRSNSRVSSFIDRALECRKSPLGDNEHPSDQDCFLHLLKENRHGEGDRALFIPQWKMNAFPEEIPCYDQRDQRKWEPGMFVLHFAGAWAHMPNETDAKATLFKKYGWQVVPEESNWQEPEE